MLFHPYPSGVVDLQRTASLEPAIVDGEGDRVEHRTVRRIERTIDEDAVVVGEELPSCLAKSARELADIGVLLDTLTVRRLLTALTAERALPGARVPTLTEVLMVLLVLLMESSRTSCTSVPLPDLCSLDYIVGR